MGPDDGQWICYGGALTSEYASLKVVYYSDTPGITHAGKVLVVLKHR
jgi:hypothetical protein